MFGQQLASVLTGVTVSQLRNLRRKGILVPEVRAGHPPIYSFRDLVALRTIGRLRAETSAQRVVKALRTLPLLDMTRHPSQYTFTTNRDDIYVQAPGGDPISLLRQPGMPVLVTFEDVLAAYENFKGEQVVDFRHPSTFLELDADRMSGMPTLRGTRVDFLTVVDEVDPADPDSIAEFVDDHAGVTAEAVRDALAFNERLTATG